MHAISTAHYPQFFNAAAFGNATGFYCSRMGVLGCSGWTAKAGGRFVFEGQALMRRKGWIYLFYSASVWSSTNYGVSWLAAPSVRELADGSVTRLEGQFVVPYDIGGVARQTFGHGRPILGPDGVTWYFSFHHLAPKAGSAPRRAFLAPITFVDLRDGRGNIWIQPVLPPVDSNANRRGLDVEDVGEGGAPSPGACGGEGAAAGAAGYEWGVRDAAGRRTTSGGSDATIRSDGSASAELGGLRSGQQLAVSVSREGDGASKQVGTELVASPVPYASGGCPTVALTSCLPHRCRVHPQDICLSVV